MLLATLTTYAKVFPDLAVVLRPEDVALEGLLDNLTVDVVLAHDASLGMGHSLAAGIAAVGTWDYAFVALADMPFVEAATLTTLDEKMQAAPAHAIVRPTYRGAPGHPVGFDAVYFAMLGALHGDAGARSVVAAHADAVIDVEIGDVGVVKDLDTPPR